jgi:nitrate reductase (NAD(P)H)
MYSVLFRIYYPNSQFPDGGRMTLGFADLAVGDSVELKGPIGDFVWRGQGVALLHGKERRVREIGMVCGGSGITPILQVLRAILQDPLDGDTKVWVLDANRNFEDILCRDELDQLLNEHSSRFHLHYTLTGGVIPDGWTYSKGRISDEMLKIHLPTPAEDKLICICGPSPMEQATKGAIFRVLRTASLTLGRFIGALIKFGWNAATGLHIF